MIFTLIEDLLGEAPNEFIAGLYYVLAIILIVFFLKVILLTMRSVFKIGGSVNRF